jgi:uncharacterized protein (UPF0333 family)
VTHTTRASERGVSILGVMVIVVLVAGIASAFLLLTMNEASVSNSSRNKMRAMYCAEAGAEHAANLVRVGISGNLGAVANIDGQISIGTGPEKVDVDYAAKYRSDLPDETDESGLYTQRQSYEILAECRINGEVGRVFRVVEARVTPIFQFLAFYDGDLEANPGPAGYWNGRLHTNQKMYITDRDGSAASKSGYGLVIDSEHVQAVGGMYRRYKGGTDGSPTPVETGANGRVRIRQKGTEPIDNAALSPDKDDGLIDWGLDSGGGPTESSALKAFGGSVKDGNTGAQTMAPPDVETIAKDGYFHEAARNGGLVIEDGRVYQGGEDITAKLPAGTVQQTTLYDAREQTSVPVTTIDVNLLMTSEYRPPNGLIFGVDNQASVDKPRGFHLINGGTIPPSGDTSVTPDGLTFVTPTPTYVQGDYNAHTYTKADLDAGKIPGNNAGLVGMQDPSHPTQPCAIIADAVNLLSNKWDNSKIAGKSPPPATPTSYNMAMISGNQTTEYDKSAPGSGYNGGLQNLPRFHENWGGINCNIKGSFVNLWESTIANGVYGLSNVYTPPKRFWDFDQSFNDPSRLPPWTPKVTTIGRTTYEEGWTRSSTYDLEIKKK